jgi:hypothetical protein
MARWHSTERKPALIFGAGNKLRAGGPYLELLRRFEASLEAQAGLVVVGYSFRDDHINAIVTSWMNGDVSRRLVVLDPAADELTRRGGAYGGDATLGTQLAWLGQNHPARVKLIAQTAADGLPDAIISARNGFGAGAPRRHERRNTARRRRAHDRLGGRG